MQRLIVIIMTALFATATLAADMLETEDHEVKIVETESGITVEYAGSPSSTASDTEIPAAATENDNAPTDNSPAAQLEQLKMEVDEILNLSGNETEDELQAKEALAAEKKLQIEFYEDEIRQTSGKPQTDAIQNNAPRDETQSEIKKRFKELRKSRKAFSGGSTSE